MGTSMYGCGCYVSRSMFGEREVMAVGHCWQHIALYSQDKTPRFMAEEIAAQDHTRREMPVPDRPAGGLYA